MVAYGSNGDISVVGNLISTETNANVCGDNLIDSIDLIDFPLFAQLMLVAQNI